MIFRSIFIKFSCFFKNRSQRAFLEGKGADLYSKVRFFVDFWIPVGPKIDPWGSIFAKKGFQKSGLFVPEPALRATSNVQRARLHVARVQRATLHVLAPIFHGFRTGF